MVVIFFAPTADTGVTQARVGSPSRWMVQAPHWATPHPNLVPFRSRTSRITQSRGMSAGTSTDAARPFTVSV